MCRLYPYQYICLEPVGSCMGCARSNRQCRGQQVICPAARGVKIPPMPRAAGSPRWGLFVLLPACQRHIVPEFGYIMPDSCPDALSGFQGGLFAKRPPALHALSKVAIYLSCHKSPQYSPSFVPPQPISRPANHPSLALFGPANKIFTGTNPLQICYTK